MIVGIDAGGSKTRGALMVDDVVRAEAVVGSANLLSVGPQEARRQLDRLAAELGAPPGAVVCAGIAGMDTPAVAARARALVAGAFGTDRVEVVHDTRLVLAAAGAGEGIALICGTGSVAWGRTAGGAEARAGGWGHLLGDDSSGYGITRSAVRHALRRSDAGRPVDPLTAALLGAAGADDAAGLVERFHTEPSRRLWAGLAHVVFDLAPVDAVAAGLVADAAADLARLVDTVGERLGTDDPVVLAGGLILHQPMLERLVRAGLPGRDVRRLEVEPVHGALALAQAGVPRGR